MSTANSRAEQTAWQRIHDFNQGRDAETLQVKYKLMRDNLYSFFRGTCHLFYEDWPVDSNLNKAPFVWNCGDLHLENFGTYRSSDRLTYFDINDFDESVLAPCTWDLGRFLTSILVATHTVEIPESEAIALCHSFLESYCQALKIGKAFWTERSLVNGIVKDLIETTAETKRRDLLEERTDLRKSKRRLRLREDRYLPVEPSIREKIEKFMAGFAAQQAESEFFELIDVAKRVAGTASLGLERYVLLIEGKGSPDGNYLLDLKQSRASALLPYVNKLNLCQQPSWSNQAERIVAVQTRMQAVEIAFLQAVTMEGQAYVLKELQPNYSLTDALKLEKWQDKLKHLDEAITWMGKVVAWSQLRSSGRQGSAIADELITFSDRTDWAEGLLNYALQYQHKVKSDWEEFQTLYKTN